MTLYVQKNENGRMRMEETLTQELRRLLNGGVVFVRFGVTEVQKSFTLQLKQEVREGLIQQGVDQNAIVTSVSHTQVGQESWVLVVGSDQRVGVDLECAHRKVHPRLVTRILSDQERTLEMSVLEAWVAKEAGFKANPQNQGTVLPQYRLTAWNPKFREGEMLFPTVTPVPSEQARARVSFPSLASWSCKFKVLRLEDWWVGLATAFPQNGEESGTNV